MNKLKVLLNFGQQKIHVGELFLSEKLGRYVFNYAADFIPLGLSISPFELPLSSETFIAKTDPHLYNLHSVFADALPDEWGKKVQDCEFQKLGKLDVTALERLSFIGNFGLGALSFEPIQSFSGGKTAVELAVLRKTSQQIIQGDVSSVVDALFKAGGSAGGARPKYLVDINTSKPGKIRYSRGKRVGEWLPALLKVGGSDGDHWQRIEYVYFELAKKSGLAVPQVYLLEEKKGLSHFAIERFDINSQNQKYHMHTFAGLLGLNFQQANLDYELFLRTIGDLTRDKQQVEEGFRRMVFNFLACNKDDHGKNFSFLMDKTGNWSLSPAYDLSYSSGTDGLHAMSANGKRRNLNISDFEKIANAFNVSNWKKILEAVSKALSYWEDLAQRSAVPEKYIKNIQERMKENLNRIVF